MRAIQGIEIYSPSNSKQVRHIAEKTLREPALRYVRLERSVSPRLSNRPGMLQDSGIELLKEFRGKSEWPVIILSSGYLLDRALDVAESVFHETGISIQVLDIWKIKTLNLGILNSFVADACLLVTLEEQARDGAFGSAILEAVSDLGLLIPVTRISLQSAFAFENGTRDELLDFYGLSRIEIQKQVMAAIRKEGVINDGYSLY
jgi:transketolase C-terminal domain/subunit